MMQKYGFDKMHFHSSNQHKLVYVSSSWNLTLDVISDFNSSQFCLASARNGFPTGYLNSTRTNNE